MDKAELTLYIKSEAERLGFDICGIAKAEAVPNDVVGAYNNWITHEQHGTMYYLQRNCDKRFNPTLLVDGCKSIVVVVLNYYPSNPVDGSGLGCLI